MDKKKQSQREILEGILECPVLLNDGTGRRLHPTHETYPTVKARQILSAGFVHKDSLSEIIDSAKNVLYWKKKADETPEMLLSSKHGRTDECIEIMKNYEQSFKDLASAIAKGKVWED